MELVLVIMVLVDEGFHGYALASVAYMQTRRDWIFLLCFCAEKNGLPFNF